jgi:hypothetical protein
MSRIRLLVGVSVGGITGIVLAGCSSSSPDLLKPAPPPPQALQFESTPPGVNVQTSTGQTCRTPCSLAVPVMSQSVMFTLNGYVSQTIPLSVREPEHSFFNQKPPYLLPNPVQVAMVVLPPPPKIDSKLRRAVGTPKLAPKVAPKPVAAAPAPMTSAVPRPIAAPEPQDNAFPHPPPWSQSPSGSESPFPSPVNR